MELRYAQRRNFAFTGHVEGSPPFPATCVPGQSYTEAWETDPLTSGRWATLAGTTSFVSGEESLNAGSPNSQIWAAARAWTNYTVSVPIRYKGGGNSGITFRMNGTLNATLPNDGGNMYYVGVDNGNVYLGPTNGGYAPIASASVPIVTGTVYALAVTANGSNIRVSINGTQYIKVTDSTYSSGSVGLRTFNGAMGYGPMTITCL